MSAWAKTSSTTSSRISSALATVFVWAYRLYEGSLLSSGITPEMIKLLRND